MSLVLSVPSKTYLTGEYAVMVGGSAIVLNTGPRFSLRANYNPNSSPAGEKAVDSNLQEEAQTIRVGEGKIKGIPEQAPALKWLKQRQPLLNNWHLEFVDPHTQRGGFGASGAQFVLAHSFTSLLQMNLESAMKVVAQATSNQVEIIHSATKIETNALDAVIAKIDSAIMLLDPKDVWNDYQIFSKSGSGADLLAQMEGHVALINMAKCEATSQGWPYKNMGFAIVRTGEKIPTHEHLASLRTENLQALKEPALDAVAAFGLAADEEFAKRVRSYGLALRELGYQAPKTLELLGPIEQQGWCLAAKGCGAFGADTLLVLFKAAEREAVLKFLQKQRLEVVAMDVKVADAEANREGTRNRERPITSVLETGLKVNAYAN